MDTYEKKYKEIVGKIRKAYLYAQTDSTKAVLEDIIPELVESEDEKVRKEIIRFIQMEVEDEIVGNKWLAWLGKQAERKTPQWMIDFLDSYRRKIGCSLDHDEARDVEGKILCIMQWLENQGQVKESTISQHEIETCKENNNSLTSEDEKVRKALLEMVHDTTGDELLVDYNVHKEEALAWLERQGDYANFRDKAQVGDRITKNEDGVLVNLSQLKRMAKPREKQGEQKASYTTIAETGDGGINALVTRELPTDGEQKSAGNVCPKFHEGEWIACEELNAAKIVKINVDRYEVEFTDGNKAFPHIDYVDRNFHLWSIGDAKDGDVLTNGKMVVIFKHFEEPSYRQHIVAYIGLDRGGDIQITDDTWKLGIDKAKPATKEQRDTLMKAMVDAGYTFDFERKELKKIEDKEYNGEDYGIDSLYHAQRILEKTLGSVEGYQSDDGILEHKCAITAVKKLYEQKLAENAKPQSSTPMSYGKELEERMYEACDRFYAPNTDSNRYSASDLFYAGVKAERDLNTLAWSEEDEKNLRRAIRATKVVYPVAADWLRSLQDRVQPQPKQGEQNLVLRDTFGYEDGRLFGMNEGIGLVLDNPEKYGLQKPIKWSKEDENVISLILSICNDFLESFEISSASTKVVKEDVDKIENWLKSIRPQNKCAYNPYKAVVESIAEMCKHYDKASHSGLRDFYDNVKVKCKDAKEYNSIKEE